MQTKIGDITVTSSFNGDIELTQRGPDESEDIIFVPAEHCAAVAAALCPPAVEQAIEQAIERLIVCTYRRTLAEPSHDNNARVYWIGEQYAAKAALIAAIAALAAAAPGEVRLTTDEAAWVRTWLEPLDQWSSPVAKQIAAKIDVAAAPEEAR